MQRRVALAVLIITVSAGRASLVGECAPLPEWRLQPVKVTGAFCGRTMWMGRWSAEKTVVRLLDANGKHIATVQSDARGRFSFRRVPSGRYRVDVDESVFFDEIEIKNASATCRKRETLYLVLVGSECPGGIARPLEADPSTVRGDGLPRER